MTFLFTDIEGSTRLVQDLGETWPETLEAHSDILSGAIDSCRGVTVRTEGDSFFAVFEEPLDAVEAAVAAQRGIASADWPLPLRVRMGVHTGTGHLGGDDYVGRTFTERPESPMPPTEVNWSPRRRPSSRSTVASRPV